MFARCIDVHILSITSTNSMGEPRAIHQRRQPNQHMIMMAVTFLTLPENCRNLILHFCLLQHKWVVVESSNCDAPGVLRTCTQLRNEGTMMFHRENTFLLMLRNPALPQGHWIHGVADVSKNPVITRIREQKEPPGSPQKWLSAFYNGKTKIRWVPFRPGSETQSKHPLVNVLRHGFLLASLLKAQSQEKEEKEDCEQNKRRQHSAELVLEVWCETAKRAWTLGHHLRGGEGRDLYRRAMESLDGYHYDPRTGLSPEGTRVKIIFEEAFAIIDIMQDEDWQVVQQVLRYWFQTMCRESAERLCAGSGKSLATERRGPRHQNPHWLRARRSIPHGQRSGSYRT
jgi:hypothetical protein